MDCTTRARDVCVRIGAGDNEFARRSNHANNNSHESGAAKAAAAVAAVAAATRKS